MRNNIITNDIKKMFDKFKIKKSEDIVFVVFILCVVLLFLASAFFSREPNYGPDMWDDGEPFEVNIY